MPTQTEMKGQEWTQITFTKPKSAVKPAETMKAAQRAGNVLQERKHNRTTTAAGLSARALDEDTETLKHATVSTDLKLAIMKARTAKGLTQKQLADVVLGVHLVYTFHFTTIKSDQALFDHHLTGSPRHMCDGPSGQRRAAPHARRRAALASRGWPACAHALARAS